MKVVSAAFAASVLALATVGCGSTSGNVTQTTHPATHEVTSEASSPAATTGGNSTVNERAFADALASTTSLIPSSVISGPVMRAYRLVEYEIAAANAAAGNPLGKRLLRFPAATSCACRTPATGLSAAISLSSLLIQPGRSLVSPSEASLWKVGLLLDHPAKWPG